MNNAEAITYEAIYKNFKMANYQHAAVFVVMLAVPPHIPKFSIILWNPNAHHRANKRMTLASNIEMQ
jgi:hypothetical protein